MKSLTATRFFAIPTVIATACFVLSFAWILLGIQFELPNEYAIWPLMISLAVCFLTSLGTTIACFRAKSKGNDEDYWMVVIAIPIFLLSALFLTMFLKSYFEAQNRTGTYGGRGKSKVSLHSNKKTAVDQSLQRLFRGIDD